MKTPAITALNLAILLSFSHLAGAQSTESAAQDTADDEARTLDAIIVKGAPLGLGADKIVQPVEVLAGKKLDVVKSNTLGETVSSLPGVSTTYFGPGVGRPVIRGLDGSRVSLLNSGMGSDDVSNVSQDHAVSIEPFLADQIEVFKGPSTLLYGTGAIGGVVNVVDGRIQEKPMDTGVSGRAEMRFDSGSQGSTGMARVDSRSDNYALHVDGVYRNNGNYNSSSGKIANSAVDTKTGAIAASMFGDWGFAGFSVARYLNNYGNPAEPGDDVDPGVTLDMAQTRYDLKAGFNNPFSGFESLKFNFGRTDYTHTEFEGNEIGTVFVSEGDQFRAEAVHNKIGVWQGAFGLQVNRREFNAIGEEAFVPFTKSRGAGIFAMERAEWETFTLELGARYDRQSSTPEGGEKRNFSLTSLSAGGRWEFIDNWHLSLNLDRAQRAPAEEELFANGPHVATQTFEIGDPTLQKETSNQVELGLHYHSDFITAKISVYHNRFDNFIYLNDTGLFDPDDALPIRNWTQTDATFRGAEAEAIFHLAETDEGKYDLRFFADTVRAKRDGGNLPRIPAARIGAQLDWQYEELTAGIGLTRTFAQNDTDTFETETESYTFLNANLSYNFYNSNDTSWNWFIQGTNLTNRAARISTSFIKDAVPLPGRNLAMGLRIAF
jgi:iron complex outermembrane recepter protein